MASFVTSEEACKSWEKSGRNEFLKFCRSRISEASDDGIITGSVHELSKGLRDLIDQTIKGTLKQELAVSTLSASVDIHPGVASILVDVFNIKDIETTSREENTCKENLISLLTACSAFLDSRLLKERLDNDTLDAINILSNKQAFAQRYVRLKTKLYYKQQKFNLLREESEGFAKLVSELTQVTVDPATSSQVSKNIKALIGGFDLDPNRVLDIILEAFETAPEQDHVFVPLLRSYMCDPLTVCQVLGFKFQFYKEENIRTPKSLHKVAAQLLQHHIVELDDIYPHLAPSDVDIFKAHKQEIIDARQYARKMSMAVLADKDDKDDKEKEKDKDEQVMDNQKIGLCESMILIGDWVHAKKLLDKLPEYGTTSNPTVAKALCNLIESLLQPLYKKSCQPQGAKGYHIPAPPKNGTLQAVQRLGNIKGVLEMCRYLGPYASLQPILIWKLVRLGKALLAERASSTEEKKEELNGVFHEMLSMIEQVILPSISMMPCNACLSEEVWSLMKMLPYHRRYCLYARWINHCYGIHPPLIRVKANTTDRAKYIMKRLTKENVKPSGRQLGKLSHSNPGVLFSYVLSQIQMYDNLIGPVVDSLKYLTSLSFDILAYCVIEALANPEKERMKHDETSLSLWMQSLAAFCGAMFRKYNIELTGLLQFVANQLKVGKSFDLLILREVVLKMAGIEVTEEMTADQLEALAGGELLRAEGGYFTQVRNTKRSSQRLKEALLEDDLAVTMCMLMAQEKYRVVYKHEQGTHLKLVGMLYDQCQDTLVQLGGFLSNLLSIEDYSKHFPDLVNMVTNYHLTPESAFFLYRPMCTHAIQSKVDDLKRQEKSSKSSGNRTQRYVQASQVVMSPLTDGIISFHPPKVWDDISPQFYASFWTLSMYDLHVPSPSYEKEINKIKVTMATVDDNKEMASAKRKKEKERFAIIIDRLKDEERKQQEHCQRIEARLKKECETWFTARSTKNETITQFLQLCVFPRCCFSASDALYCAKFVLTVHKLKTPNFSTLLCYDRVFQDITYTVASCTENEAIRYGRFLCAMMETVMKWHGDKETYEKECGNFPGFVTVLRASGTESSNKADQLDYENFRHVCHKWQYKLTKAVVACLESKEYTQIRNTLILLTKILQYFPLVQNLGQVLEKRVDKIRTEEKEKRPDIYALAMGYSGQLKARKQHMIPEDKFHYKDKPAPAPQATSQSSESTSKKTTPSSSSTSVSSTSNATVNGVGKENHSKDADNEKVHGASSKSSNRDSSSAKSSSTSKSSVKSSSQVQGKSSSSSKSSSNSSSKASASSSNVGASSSSGTKKSDSKSSNESSKSKRDKEDHKEGSINRSKDEKVSKEHRVVKEDKTVKEGKVQRSSEGKRSGSSEKPHREDGKASSSKEHKNYSGDHWGGAPSSELDSWAEEGERVRKVEKKSSHRDNKAKEKEERGGDGGHRSSKERSQREESVASNSSQGSVGSSSRKESPATSSSDRVEHKRRKVDTASVIVSSSSSPDLARETSSGKHRRSKSKESHREREVLEAPEAERERSRDKEKKSEKKRDHSAGDVESKRHKVSDSGHEGKSGKRSSLGDGASSSSSLNGERMDEREREREMIKEEKASRRESDVRDKPAKEKKIKREPIDDDRDEDRHKSSSSRKRRP
ncbi:THO complex subunit 2 isoform X1 [Strongylocentrotus purpuratus]|uniref:THO complex subunit 2 n=1 Tax=Strongylocentrotus purpuratus TaxID=7668 RepID=A0A7M7NHS8_STRPU|nr:THO complex subunit 2 isoform X1 [Strongylocentrotus purpuratus]